MSFEFPQPAAFEKDRARQSLRAFVEQAWHVLEPATAFVPGIHVDGVCEHLQAVSENRIRNLILNIPPGHAKSLITAVFWPAWDWIETPQRRWIFSSYRTELAVRDSVKCRALIDSHWYQERWGKRFRFREDQNQKTRYENDKTGYRVIASVGAGTGERGDIVVCDDPTSVDQAESEAARRTANEWWSGSMTTRPNDPKTGHLVVIQQRLHEEDLTGYLLDRGGYEILVLPEEFEPDRACHTSIGWKDPRTREGELLWPQKLTAADLDLIKRDLGSYRYAGQYQQRPAPAGGGILKRWWWRYWQPRYMDLPPVDVKLEDGSIEKVKALYLPEDFDEQLQSWDMAFKNLETSDYVAGGVWGSHGAHRFLIDQRRARLDFPETVAAVESMSRKWPKATLKLIEGKANGPAVIQTLRGKIQGLVEVEPQGGKVARAQAVSAQIEAGNVFVPHPAIAPWIDQFLHECSTFPHGRYDDQVDQTTQALLRLKTRPPKTATPTSRMPSGERGWMV